MQKILVIDDEQLHLDHAAKILRDAGYEVITASDGREGLEILAASIPDLVLSDAMMPDVDGYGVLEKMREDPRLRDLPFAMFTGLRVKGLRTESKQQGAQEFLNKPYKSEDLLEVVRRLLNPGS